MEALALAQQHHPRLLITDVVMPVENGPSVYKKIKAVCPGIPVLYISGYSGESLIEQGLDLGGGAFLAKPFRHVELIEAVSRVLAAVEGQK